MANVRYKSYERVHDRVRKSLTIEHGLINEGWRDGLAVVVQSSYQLVLLLL